MFLTNGTDEWDGEDVRYGEVEGLVDGVSAARSRGNDVQEGAQESESLACDV